MLRHPPTSSVDPSPGITAPAGRRLIGALLASLLLLALVPTAASRADSGPDLGDLALDWARGRYG